MLLQLAGRGSNTEFLCCLLRLMQFIMMMRTMMRIKSIVIETLRDTEQEHDNDDGQAKSRTRVTNGNKTGIWTISRTGTSIGIRMERRMLFGKYG